MSKSFKRHDGNHRCPNTVSEFKFPDPEELRGRPLLVKVTSIVDSGEQITFCCGWGVGVCRRERGGSGQ